MNTLALGPSWLDPDYLIQTFGLIGVLVIVFAESGLLIGFFLPGDSLLFTTGLLVTTNKLDTPLWAVCAMVVAAAVLGDQVGYLFGRKVGPSLFKRPDSKLFKQENVEKAHEFFEKHGPKSLILARFVPIVRTFTPIIAGVSRMNYRSFIVFNLIGGLLWGAGVTLLGSALGKIEFVNKHIELILVGIVLISVVPVAIEVLRARAQAKKNPAPQTPDAPDTHDTHGDQGTYGDQGAHGAYDAYGNQGTYGDQGTHGAYDAYGNHGTYGDQGTYGSQGTYDAHGAYGDQGTYGNHGTYGDQGTYGSQGTYDAHGTYGDQGTYGTHGTHGTDGPQNPPQEHGRHAKR
ncbi:VTT domain-containing protein [Streptomyces sp. NPDC046203]|uniref:VTT domain-containing protein n=1 Tax=Streptomyces sp. NPDC046203 TaxID=3154602 RepID=UPI0033EB8741